MSHAHKHCAHTHLSFCSICQVVYCHDCDQEWAPRQTWWGTTYTLPTTTTYGYKSMTNAESPAQMPGTNHHHGG